MQQQINLYRLLPKKPTSQLTGKRALLAYGALVLLIFLIYIIELSQEQDLIKQSHRLDSELSIGQQNLGKLVTEYPVRDAPALKNTLTEMREQVEKKSRLLSSVTTQTNISTYLAALASIDMQDLWLTKMNFNHLAQQINLEGSATQSGAVEKLLVQLRQQPVFSSVKFSIENVTEGPSSVSFKITSTKGMP